MSSWNWEEAMKPAPESDVDWDSFSEEEGSVDWNEFSEEAEVDWDNFSEGDPVDWDEFSEEGTAPTAESQDAAAANAYKAMYQKPEAEEPLVVEPQTSLPETPQEEANMRFQDNHRANAPAKAPMISGKMQWGSITPPAPTEEVDTQKDDIMARAYQAIADASENKTLTKRDSVSGYLDEEKVAEGVAESKVNLAEPYLDWAIEQKNKNPEKYKDQTVGEMALSKGRKNAARDKVMTAVEIGLMMHPLTAPFATVMKGKKTVQAANYVWNTGKVVGGSTATGAAFDEVVGDGASVDQAKTDALYSAGAKVIGDGLGQGVKVVKGYNKSLGESVKVGKEYKKATSPAAKAEREKLKKEAREEFAETGSLRGPKSEAYVDSKDKELVPGVHVSSVDSAVKAIDDELAVKEGNKQFRFWEPKAAYGSKSAAKNLDPDHPLESQVLNNRGPLEKTSDFLEEKGRKAIRPTPLASAEALLKGKTKEEIAEGYANYGVKKVGDFTGLSKSAEAYPRAVLDAKNFAKNNPDMKRDPKLKPLYKALEKGDIAEAKKLAKGVDDEWLLDELNHKVNLGAKKSSLLNRVKDNAPVVLAGAAADAGTGALLVRQSAKKVVKNRNSKSLTNTKKALSGDEGFAKDYDRTMKGKDGQMVSALLAYLAELEKE